MESQDSEIPLSQNVSSSVARPRSGHSKSTSIPPRHPATSSSTFAPSSGTTTVPNAQTEGGGTTSKKRKDRSDVWRHFTHLEMDGVKKARQVLENVKK
ncbi:unnamed protein product [Linum tenue]|uniref:Uncharacterized protein n=1 Tax=Linum tenue TaxID=586396 RepID=A0AAV0PUL1_9ROSI|nr:unnamed protein product [Linum tenue]